MDVLDRFLRYVQVDTQSATGMDDSVFPSTEKQKNLARILAQELLEMGVTDAHTDDYGYVYGSIPANNGKSGPTIGWIAHMDTAPECSGTGVKPQIVSNYDGGDVVLNKEQGIVLRVEELFRIKECVGQDMIFTDGTTLLGADDKAGVAEIMSAVNYLLDNPQVLHGPILIAFTPDEEVGRGVQHFNYNYFKADFAYTMDGGAIGQYYFENFNAANARVVVNGRCIHTGAAKNQLKNAVRIAADFDQMLPQSQRPEHTEKYEGFFHLSELHGTTEKAEMQYHLRDHDSDLFRQKMDCMTAVANCLNTQYGDGTVVVSFIQRYRNMADVVRPSMEIVDAIRDAMLKLDIIPNLLPIRGATDGVSLSFHGIPCPNIGSGVYHGHCRYECIPIPSLYRNTELIVEITKAYA